MASAQQRGMLAAVKYREIEPHVEWMDSETVHVAAPGFKREDLRVQVTSTGEPESQWTDVRWEQGEQVREGASHSK
ncbi:unnamed protein product [Rhodiola kirilowii]